MVSAIWATFCLVSLSAISSQSLCPWRIICCMAAYKWSSTVLKCAKVLKNLVDPRFGALRVKSRLRFWLTAKYDSAGAQEDNLQLKSTVALHSYHCIEVSLKDSYRLWLKRWDSHWALTSSSNLGTMSLGCWYFANDHSLIFGLFICTYTSCLCEQSLKSGLDSPIKGPIGSFKSESPGVKRWVWLEDFEPIWAKSFHGELCHTLKI